MNKVLFYYKEVKTPPPKTFNAAINKYFPNVKANMIDEKQKNEGKLNNKRC